jgi:hypothetical protein
MSRYLYLAIWSLCLMACASCAPKSTEKTPAAKVRFENLEFKDGQLTANVVFVKAVGEHMLRMLMLEGIYKRDNVWSSEFVFLETGHWWATPAGTVASAASTNKVTGVRKKLSQLLDPQDLVAVRLRAMVWVSRTPPHLAEQEDVVYHAYQSARLPVTESGELLRELRLQR